MARAVLRTEAAGLHALAGALDDSFARAVDLLAGATGRVAVSGMGKSGHVARKIAATLASTGTPALFVDPAEASHGDLGMIVPGVRRAGAVQFGETVELADIVAHTRRFALPLVAITTRGHSALATAADIALILPPAAEACPMGLAPTIPHHATGARRRAGGRPADPPRLYRRRFPPVPSRRPARRASRTCAHLMHAGDAVPLAPPDTPMHRALLLITEKRFGCLGVIDPAGRLIGVLTDGDLRRAMGPDLLSRQVGEIMTRSPRTIAPDALAAEALHAMNAHDKPITSLFVVAPNDAPIGILHIHDLLRAGVA